MNKVVRFSVIVLVIIVSLLVVNTPIQAVSQISETSLEQNLVTTNEENKFSNELMSKAEREEQSLFLATVAISLIFVVCFGAVVILLIKLKR